MSQIEHEGSGQAFVVRREVAEVAVDAALAKNPQLTALEVKENPNSNPSVVDAAERHGDTPAEVKYGADSPKDSQFDRVVNGAVALMEARDKERAGRPSTGGSQFDVLPTAVARSVDGWGSQMAGPPRNWTGPTRSETLAENVRRQGVDVPRKEIDILVFPTPAAKEAGMVARTDRPKAVTHSVTARPEATPPKTRTDASGPDRSHDPRRVVSLPTPRVRAGS